jgi:TfoX-like protein
MTCTHAGDALAPPSTQFDAAFEALDDVLGPAPTVEPRMMFGHRCFSVAGKAFACVVDGGIALKLPREVVASLNDDAIVPFEPGGQRMGGWVAIHRSSAVEYEQDTELIETALVHISRIAAGVGG